MPTKQIREIVKDVAGNVFVEYSDDSNTVFNIADTVTAKTDALTGGNTLLAGGNTILNILKNRPLSVIPLGDSITAWGSDSAFGSYTNNGASFIHLALMSSTRPFQILRNAGVSGNTTAQILARLSTDVLAYRPDICPILAGTNNIYSGMSNADIASMMRDVEGMVYGCLRAGVLPILVTPPPKSSAIADAKKVQMFYYLLAKHYRIPLLDLYRVIVNPSTGDFASGMSLDGVHPSAAAIAAIGANFATKMADFGDSVAPNYLASVSESSSNTLPNLLVNGNFSVQTAPPAPDGWTINTTNAVLTSETPSLPYTGKTMVHTKSDTDQVTAFSSTNITSAGGGFAVGDELEISGVITASGFTPATASGYSAGLYMISNSIFPVYNFPHNGTISFSEKFVVPSGTTAMAMQVYARDAAVLRLNNITVVNNTQARAVWQPGQQAGMT